MYNNDHQRVPVLARIVYKRLDTHPVQEHGEIGEKHVQRMPYSKIAEPFHFVCFHEFLSRHNRIRPYRRTEQLGIMAMVVVMRPLPDTWRGNHINAKYGKDHICRLRAM